jgi:hypothetical protein
MFSITWNVHIVYFSKDEYPVPYIWHVMNAEKCSSDRPTVLLLDILLRELYVILFPC